MLLPGLTLAQSLSSAFQSGSDFSNGQKGTVQQQAQNPSYQNIPGYQGTNVPETQYSANSLPSKGQTEMNTGQSDAGQFASQNRQKILDTQGQHPETVTHESDPMIQHSNQAMQQGPTVTQQSGAFCDDASCTKTDYASLSQGDAEEAASALSALARATKEGQPIGISAIRTFNGSVYKCRKMKTGYDNCCSNSGWGQKIGLAGCNREENELWKLKGTKQCVKVGSYCAHRVKLIGCTERKETYCCFSSVLSRIVQQQGRPQLGWGWGSGKHPQCQGMTQTDLQRIDFSKLDYTDYYHALTQQTQVPVSGSVQQQVNQDTQRIEQQGNTNVNGTSGW